MKKSASTICINTNYWMALMKDRMINFLFQISYYLKLSMYYHHEKCKSNKLYLIMNKSKQQQQKELKKTIRDILIFILTSFCSA